MTGRAAGCWGMQGLAQRTAIVINAERVAGDNRLWRVADLEVRGALGGHECARDRPPMKAGDPMGRAMGQLWRESSAGRR